MAVKLLNTDPLGSILTRFDNCTVWPNFRRTVSMVIDAGLGARTPSSGARFEFQALDINKVPVGAPSVSAPVFDIGVVVVEIPEDQKGEQFLRARGLDSAGSVQLTEDVIFEVHPVCNNPLMVAWLNSDGGAEQYLFQINQEIENSSSEGVIFDRPIVQDSEFAFDTIGRRVMETTQRISVQADHLTTTQLKALMEIKSSSFVVVFLDRFGTKFVRVRVMNLRETGYGTRAEGKTHSINIEFEMPINFDITEAIQYDLFNWVDSDGAQIVDSDGAIIVTQ